METKFTKGNWVNLNGVICLKHNIQKVIANTYANAFGNEEKEANAKLITAAPEMISFLMEAEAWLSLNPHPTIEQISEFKESIREVIRKAI